MGTTLAYNIDMVPKSSVDLAAFKNLVASEGPTMKIKGICNKIKVCRELTFCLFLFWALLCKLVTRCEHFLRVHEQHMILLNKIPHCSCGLGNAAFVCFLFVGILSILWLC